MPQRGETVGTCVEQARTFLTANGVGGEVLVADNGSTDGSQEIAAARGRAGRRRAASAATARR